MITDQRIGEILATEYRNLSGDEQRVVYSALTAIKYNMSAAEASRYYGVPATTIEGIWAKHGFVGKAVSATKKSRKSNAIKAWLKENVGNTVTPKDIVEATGISMPTFYNFYNSNVGYFKKIKRGQFEILDPQAERTK